MSRFNVELVSSSQHLAVVFQLLVNLDPCHCRHLLSWFVSGLAVEFRRSVRPVVLRSVLLVKRKLSVVRYVHDPSLLAG